MDIKYMKNINLPILKRTALMLAIFSVSLDVAAIKAFKEPVKVKQPDGSTVTIKLHGDERAHCVTTSDGYLLTEDNNGFMVYAEVSGDGGISPSDIKARDLSDRTITDNEWLGKNHHSTDLKLLMNKRLENAKIKSTVPGHEITRGVGLSYTTYPHKGSPKAIIILVEYQDVKFKTENAYQYFEELLNKEGFSQYGATGSVLDWFKENSKGQFTPDFDLYGPVTLPQKMNYYGRNDAYGNDMRPEEMVIDACDILDATVDFSQYDTDGDGKVDNIYIFYAGYGEADGGGSNTVWPHSWDLSSASTKRYRYDGVIVDHYACSNEVDYTTKKPDGIGTFVHEFSHVLGLPDLYPTDDSDAFTPGEFSVLDYGPYNNDGRTPPNYSSYELYALDWITPLTFERSDYYELENLTDSYQCYLLPTENSNEFYLFENRQKTGNDRFIPGHGMLVWHIDFVPSRWENNDINNNASHQYVDLVEADGIQSNSTMRGDPFPGSSNVTEFTFNSSPKLQSWGKKNLGFGLYDITENDDKIRFAGLKDGIPLPTVGVEEILTGTNPYNLSGSCITAHEDLEIYDLAGRKVLSLSAGAKSVLPAKGIYILKSTKSTAKIRL